MESLSENSPKTDDKNESPQIPQNVRRKMKNHPGFRKNLREYFEEYSNNTGIHGCKYMGEANTSLFEKLSWFTFFCFSLYLCIILIINVWVKWNTSPVIVSFATSPTPVWKIPFPAITICSETKIKQTLYNFTDNLDKVVSFEANGIENVTQEELDDFYDSTLICDRNHYKGGKINTDFDTIEHLLKLAPGLKEMFVSCQWATQNKNCEEIFSPVLTEDGICYTFNMLDRSELVDNSVFFQGDYMEHNFKSEGWNLEDGYPSTAGKDHFPHRVLSAGTNAGLTLFLKSDPKDFDFSCRRSVQGFKVLLHNPTEMPRVNRQYFRASLDQEMIVSVTPEMMTTSDGLKNYQSSRRQCYFSQEKKLEFFQNYTQQNCQIECLANYILTKCGCAAYYMPHEEKTNICGAGSVKCITEAEKELLNKEVSSGVSDSNTDFIANCDCLPSCTSISYNSETSQAFYDTAKSSHFEKLNGSRLTRISIFFKEMQFITSERNELYGPTDFISNCGGLLGLFTGFSIMSSVEILSYLTLRLGCNVRKFGKHFWSGAKSLIDNQEFSGGKI